MIASGIISWPIRRTLFLRSFLLQASWNFEQMQGLGALFVLVTLFLPRGLIGLVPASSLRETKQP